MTDTVMQAIIAAVPCFTAIVTVVAVALKIVGNLSRIRSEFEKKTDYRELKQTVSKLVDENSTLRKENDRLKTQIDKVKRG